MRRTKQIFIFAIVILLTLSGMLPAFAEGIHLKDLDMSKYNELLMLSGRSSAAPDEVLGVGYTTQDDVRIHSTYANLDLINTVAVIADAGTQVTVYKGIHYGLLWSDKWVKVSYESAESTDTGYVECKYLNVFPAIEEGKTVTAEAGGYTVQIEGSLPCDAEASVEVKSTDTIPTVEGVNVAALDIKLTSFDEPYRPNDSVRVTVGGLDLFENGWTEVLHILDDAEAIAEHAADGTAIPIDDEAIVAAHSEEAAIALQATGASGVVFAEYLSTMDRNVSVVSGSGIRFSVDSFSTYYIVSGNSVNGPTNNDITIIDDDSDTNYYFVAPGTKLKLERENFTVIGNSWWGADRNNVNGVLFRTDTENVSTDYGWGWEREGLIFTYGGVGWSKGDYLYVDISSSATTGETYTITSYRGATRELMLMSPPKTLIFRVMSQADIIDNIMDNTQYPVYLSVLKNSESIPGEPSISNDSDYLYSNSGMTSLGGNSNHYGTTGSGIIDSDINSNPYFTSASDGTNTMGIADASGVNTKAVLSGINWDTFLDRIAANGTVKASDGTTITAANKAGYEVVPYVVKLQTAYGLGWHIDCYVKPKDAVQVSYDANIPEGYTAANIAVPPSTSRTPPVSVRMGNPSQNGTAVNLNGNVTATDGSGTTYTLKFKGWNTKSDGSGTTYNPGATGSFTEDTVLYALWDSNIAEGTLDISKTVVTAAGSQPAPADDTFTFTVTFPTSSGARPYTVYSAAGQEMSSGTVASGGTITLKDGEWARITGVPTGAYSVTEAAKTNYTPSSTGASGTIRGGATSEADFTNTYNVPMIYTLSYVVAGDDPSADRQDQYTAGQTITSYTPTQTGYTFDGWYTDDAYTTPWTETVMPAEDTTVYGRFVPDTADLTISKSGMASGETALFTVTDGEKTYQVAVPNGGSAVISGLSVGGTYTVTEIGGWSWRYTADSAAKSVTIAVGGSEVAFTNTRSNTSWLSDESSARNVFE